MPAGNSTEGIRNALKRCSDTVAVKQMSLQTSEEPSTVSSFSSSSSSLIGPLSQHWGNLILDLRDQDLGQHNACNLEKSSSHFTLQSRLAGAIQPVPIISRSPEGCCYAHLAKKGTDFEWDEAGWSPLDHFAVLHSVKKTQWYIDHFSSLEKLHAVANTR